ncbi:MFS general substrate transporter [Lepidopterella palustris CBS 459.81]|uniref:MFS general substrate transporter n=1 Tax=Lepidopterella palustris CBS 459.81 TaxID=1314670 RepID=A0A8E2JCM3_9PEZI|nr:MFS general substrate transporter [Lepidopterella palustris CBS 459.81]
MGRAVWPPTHGNRISVAQRDVESGEQRPQVELAQFDNEARVPQSRVSLPSRPLSEPPNGGSQARAHALAGVCVIFNCWGVNLAFGVFQEYYSNWLLWKHSQSQVAWIGSVQLALIFLLAVPVGKIFDAGIFRMVFIPGAMIMISGQFLLCMCDQWWSLFLVQGIMMGIGMGMVFMSGTLCLMTYWKDNLSAAMGLGAAGAPIGGIVYTLVARALLRYKSFKVTCLVMGAIMAVTMIPPVIIYKPYPGRAKGTKQIIDWGIFGEPSYMLMTMGMFFSFLGLYFGFYYIIVYGTDVLGMFPMEASNLLIAMLGANIVGRIVPICISVRCLGPLNTLIPCLFFSSMLMYMWMGTSNRHALYVIACVYGFTAAGVQSLFTPTISAFGVHGSPTMGVRMGVAMMAIGVAALIGAPIGGKLLGLSGQTPFYFAQVFAGTALMIGFVCVTASRLLKVGWGPEKI